MDQADGIRVLKQNGARKCACGREAIVQCIYCVACAKDRARELEMTASKLRDDACTAQAHVHMDAIIAASKP